MKVEKSRSRILFEFKNGIIIDIWENLSEIIFNRRFNLNSWQFINIEFENDRAMQGLEFIFVLLCCGIRVRIPTHPKEEHQIHKTCRNALDDLRDNSCHGWVDNKGYKAFREKKTQMITIERIRTKYNRKRIFIQ
jgi:hypothetical protein